MSERAPSPIGRITLGTKPAGERRTGNLYAPFERAGAGDGRLRTAPALDPTSMVYQGQSYFHAAPWLVIAPSFAILLAVLAFNTLGEGLREALDPVGRRGWSR